MKALKLLLAMTAIYAGCAWSHYQFSCDVYKENQKLTALLGTLYNTQQLQGLTVAELENNANNALTYTLCPQAGFGFKGNLASVPGMRSSTNIAKYQQYPDPACVLKCKLV